jgi:2-enoate reductase
VGCETALCSAQKGKNVTIVEILDKVARDMFIANRTHLLKLLVDAGVKILTETRTLGIRDEGIAIADKDGKRSLLEADTVVLALGLKANEKSFEALKDKIPEVFVIGDCAEPRNVLHAIWEGFRTARLI